jgi:hypothetical protein
MSYHYGLKWCSLPDCKCGEPLTPCHLFEGAGKRSLRFFDRKDKETWHFRYCAVCGNERADHKPLIHNGRKPR